MQRSALASSLSAFGIAAVLLGASSAAHGQNLSDRIKAVAQNRQQAASRDSSKSAMLGALLRTQVEVNFENTPARKAFEYLQTAMGVNLLVRYAGEGGDIGIDADQEIDLEITKIDALGAIERLCEILGAEESCTWQLRDGFIEIGPKERLAAPSARYIKMYPIQDLLFEPPSFNNAPDFNLGAAMSQGGSGSGGGGSGGGGSGGGGGGFGGGGGGGGGMGGGGGGSGGGGGGLIGDPGEDPEQKTKEELATQIMTLIKELVEPEGWIDNGGSWSTMQLYEGVLIIRAPDFVHRQIDGYPFAPTGASAVSVSTAESRYVTFTPKISFAENLKFRDVPVQGAVGGNGTTGGTP
ncbi:MAG: hypothetical protein DWI11_00180 [Planctomycetota bacterium]|nr:MAG: hypothetical protein DWI11_00180 [Planctomycetota bacterium]